MSGSTSNEPRQPWPARVIQNCYVVRDLEQACRRLNRLYGIGP